MLTKAASLVDVRRAQAPSYGFDGQKGMHCFSHKRPGMVRLKSGMASRRSKLGGASPNVSVLAITRYDSRIAPALPADRKNVFGGMWYLVVGFVVCVHFVGLGFPP